MNLPFHILIFYSISTKKSKSHIKSIPSSLKKNLLRQTCQSPKVLVAHNIDSSNLTRYFPGKELFNMQVTDLSRNLFHAHLNRIKLDPVLETEKLQVVGETITFHNGLLQIALAFQYLDPGRAAMETSQCLLQAIPFGGSPLLQLPGVDNNVLRDLRLFSQGKYGVTNIQDLLRLDPQQQRKALSRLTEKQFQQAINIAKNIPIL